MAISKELKKLYADAFEEGIYIREFPMADNKKVAFAGSARKLKRAGFDTKEKVQKMDLVGCSLWMAAGGGDTREEAVAEAIDMFKRSEDWIPTR